jgi:hypothetical protein
MTDSLFFDSDGISAFLWVNEQNLLNLKGDAYYFFILYRLRYCLP